MDIVSILVNYKDAYLHGLFGTLKICVVAWLSGLILGFFLTFISSNYCGFLTRVGSFFNKLIQAVPILVLLFWLHYPLQAELGVVIDPLITTMFLLSIINVFAVFSILTTSIYELPEDIIEVAKVMNVSDKDIFWKIKTPLALKTCLGTLTSQQVSILQLSIFGGLISAEEIFRVSQRINSEIYQPVEVYTGLAIFFLAVCLPLNLLSDWLKRKYSYIA